MRKKKLRLLHYPQVPCKPFIVEVDNLIEAVKLKEVLADYDLFQFNNRIKPDYANMTILEEFNSFTSEWEAWIDYETGVDDFEEYVDKYYEFFVEEKKSKRRSCTVKPTCKFSEGIAGGKTSLLSLVGAVLKEAGQEDLIIEVEERVYGSKGYLEALEIVSEYVELV